MYLIINLYRFILLLFDTNKTQYLFQINSPLQKIQTSVYSILKKVYTLKFKDIKFKTQGYLSKAFPLVIVLIHLLYCFICFFNCREDY